MSGRAFTPIEMASMTEQCPYERDKPLSIALSLIQEELGTLNLSYRLQLLGAKGDTVHVRLLDASNSVVGDGTGKGSGAECLVGALYEALEHYCTYRIDDRYQHLLVKIADLAKVKECRDERVISLLRAEPDKTVMARKYYSVDRTELHYPVFITDPFHWRQPPAAGETFDCRTLIRYGSNSGTAIGATEDEAFVHAVNEVIERDACSVFLRKFFYMPEGERLSLVPPDALPEDLRQLVRAISEEVAAGIHIVDITSRFAVPTYFAVAERSGRNQATHGFGTSLHPLHAIRRALTELLQMHHSTMAFDSHTQLNKRQVEMEGFPNLLRCMQLDIRDCIDRSGVEISDGLPQYPAAKLTAYEHRLVLIERVRAAGSHIYTAKRYASDSGVTVLTCVIPGCDRFFLVTYGAIVVPSEHDPRQLVEA